ASRALGQLEIEAHALKNLGMTHRALGQFSQATHYYQQAVGVHRQHGDRREEAIILRALGELLREAGQPAPGDRSLHQALNLFEALGAPEAAELREQLATDTQLATDP
ncbi:MAG TPA: tetratricopeptide repeat protein, partial [Streptosporangiaceae bacterium]|nr:tetratricopeptide repeat protein [Streptosporangiaceae bacterium]